MATGNPYDDGLGTGGKFRKRPFRRSQATPYDRPSTAIRNPTLAVNNSKSNGWLSKLMDPAQRLITSSAHMLFGSVFRKRLPAPPAPSQPPETDAVQRVREEDHMEDIILPAENPSVIHGEFKEHDNRSNSSNPVGLTELEQILGQKTFTRSEIDRLTTLLHSRTVDTSLENSKRSEVIPSNSVVSYDRKEEEIYVTPNRRIETHSPLIFAPLDTKMVLDDDIASPAELARAYMGGRPSKASPSVSGLRSQVVREDPLLLSNRPYPKSPMMSVVPRSAGHIEVTENISIAPRSRGRSAVYSMARTPYSRIHSTTISKGARSRNEDFGVTSSSPSQSAWELNRLSGSNRGALKRRSSTLDNGIGSVGPIRRIRQKSNLISTRNSCLPTSENLYSGLSIDAGYDAQPSSSKQKEILSSEKTVPSTNSYRCSTPVPLKSSEMASKILEQLDKLVPSKEKSPTKLSPSMLHGPALKSLENVDSSKLLENVQYDAKPSGLLSDARESTKQKQEKAEKYSLKKSAASCDKLGTVMNGVEPSSSMDHNLPSDNATNSPVVTNVAIPPPLKQRPFRMSAKEDYVDLDEDDYSNGVTYPSGGGVDKLDNLETRTTVSEPVKVEEAPSLLEAKPLASTALVNFADNGNAAAALDAVKGSIFASTVASPSPVVQPAVLFTDPNLSKAPEPNKTMNASLFSSGEKLKESPCNIGVNNDSKAVKLTGALLSSANESPFKLSTSLGSKSEMQSSPAGAVDSSIKPSIKDNTVNSNIPTGSIFSFGTTPNGSSPDNRSFATGPSSFSSLSSPLAANMGNGPSLINSSFPSVIDPSSNAGAASLTGNNGNTTNSISCSPAASLPFISTATPAFQFGSSVAPASVTAPAPAPASSPSSAPAPASVVPLTIGTGSTEAKTNSTAFTAIPFGGALSAVDTTESKSVTRTFPSVTTTANNLFGGVPSGTGSTGGNIFSGTASSTTGTLGFFASSTTSATTTTGTNIFGSTTSATTTTGTNIFGSTTSAISSAGGNLFTGTSSSMGSSGLGLTAAPVATTNQSQVTNPFMSGNIHVPAGGTGNGTSSQSTPFQFGSSSSAPSSASVPSFALAAKGTFSSGTSPFGSSSAGSTLFSSNASFGLSSSSSSGLNNTISSSSSTSASVFGSSWQAPKSPVFGSTFSSPSLSTGFSYGVSSSGPTASTSAPMIFGSTTGAPSSPIFSFNSAPVASPSQPVFGNPTPAFAFNSASNGGNDQMSMEDSMAEDTVQATTSTVPVFGQQSIAPPQSNFVFGAPPSSGSSPFQFGGQQNIAAPQNPSPFQASNSLEFNAGGSFSLGSGGGDKSARRYVKVKSKNRKK